MSQPDRPSFYTDEHIPSAVAEQVQRQGVDIIRCQDVEMRTATDPEYFALAIAQGRIIVTRDQDFLALHAKWMMEGRSHAGIVFVNPKNWENIGLIVGELTYIHETLTADEMRDRVWFI